MNEPRNVTPEEELRRREGDVRQDEFSTRHYRERGEGGEWSGWTWASRGRSFPWLGVLLVLVGLALLIQYVYPQVSVGTLVLLAIGLAFLAGWLLAGSWFSMVPGILLIAFGTAELLEDLAVFGPAGEDVPGLASSALAIGFVIIWLIGYVRQRRSNWPLWGAAIFGLIGVAQLSGRLIGAPALGALWPVVIIVIGVVLLISARRRA